VSRLGIEIDGLAVAYGDRPALDGLDLAVAAGSTLAVLGPNGAGKTTLVRVLATQLRPDRGRAFVDGIDVVERPAEVRRRIGVTGQYAGLDDYLTTVENLELIGRLSGLAGTARTRARDLVDAFGLHDLATRRVGALSGGSRRRVDLAASLVLDPAVLFLDEPTTGLDPVARVALWDAVAELNERGATVLLTTQYLDEADRLADRVVVLDLGRVAAHGTPAELKSLVGGKVIHATVPSRHLDRLPLVPDVTEALDGDRLRVSFKASDAASAATVVALVAGGVDGADVLDLEVTSPSLDDVFFHLADQGALT
jgi:ABC-2 type transport system ATP-binding protein